MLLVFSFVLVFCLAVALFFEKKYFLFSRDLWWGLKLVRVLINAKLISIRKTTVADFWEWRVAKSPKAIGMVFEGKTITFEEMDAQVNQIAYWAMLAGIVSGDVVGLLMENRPEFIFTWLALAKLGASASLLNNNLRDKPLLHTLRVCDAKMLIFGVECVDSVVSIVKDLPSHVRLFSVGGDCSKQLHPHECVDAVQSWAALPSKQPPAYVRLGARQSDILFFIYTSGTTGLPKAARIKHSRFLTAAQAFAVVSGVHSRDRIFCPLPIYHSAAGMIGIGMSWYMGCPLVLVRKFSASRFWKDCEANGCTVMQYVGELCRFLIAQPPGEFDRKHHVRLAIGNGLRADVWKEFTNRFGPQICEFYGSTEGNVTLWNPMGQVGAVGYLPLPMRLPNWIPTPSLIKPFRLIRFDVENEVPMRNSAGRCVPCNPGEVGIIVGKIVQSNPAQEFEGYTNPEATQKKIIRDVFVQGDSYFLSGDLLRMDSMGFFYFVDRVGDTFRWKGENVSTLEVAEALSSFPLFNQVEINVYGVAVTGYDGRCGMACIVHPPLSTLQLKELAAHVQYHLPHYAWPIFLRFSASMEFTGTFKQRKVNLVEEGIDPMVVRDPIFVMPSKSLTYIPLQQDVYHSILSGETRL